MDEVVAIIQVLWLDDSIANAILSACPSWKLGTLLIEDERGEPSAAGLLERVGDRVKLEIAPLPQGSPLLAARPQ